MHFFFLLPIIISERNIIFIIQILNIELWVHRVLHLLPRENVYDFHTDMTCNNLFFLKILLFNIILYTDGRFI